MKRMMMGLTMMLGVLAGGCGGGSTPTTPPPPPPPPGPLPVAAVQVTLAQSTLTEGQNTQATAVLRDAAGTQLSGRTVTWSTSGGTAATVSNTGRVTAVSAGSTTITASSEGRSGSATVQVTSVPVATVTLATAQASLTPGGGTQVTAALRGAGGQTLVGRSVVWQSSNAAVATVDATGLVSALTVGTTTITATSEGHVGSIQIVVASASAASVVITPGSAALFQGQSVAFQATVRDANQSVLTGRTVTWESTNPAVATVAQTGQVIAVASGTTTIRALVDGLVATAQVTVSNVPVASVSLNSVSVGLPVGEVFVLIATPRDANSNPLPGRAVQWTSTDLTVVNGYVYADTAVITGLKVGSSTITATSEGKSRSILVTVTPPPVANVCAQIAGALVYGDDGQYLGRLTNRYDAQSVYNEYGTYGSPYSSTSTNNRYGQYGSPYSSLSAWNPYTSTPPKLYKGGVAIAYFTVNKYLSSWVSPAYAQTCNFP